MREKLQAQLKALQELQEQGIDVSGGIANIEKALRDLDEKDAADAKARADQERADAEAKAAKKAELVDKHKGLIDQVKAAKKVEGHEGDDRLTVLFEALVPPNGQAETVAGEIARALMRVLYRWYNDGDKFYEGYGLETVAGSMAYLAEYFNFEDDVVEFMESGEGADDDAYEEWLLMITNDVIDDLLDHEDDFSTANDTDSRDYSAEWIEDEQPRYDYEIEVSDALLDHIQAGNCDSWALKEFVENAMSYSRLLRDAEVDRPWGHNDTSVSISNLTKDGLEELQDETRNLNAFWEDLVSELNDEYGDPNEEDEDDEDYDEDEDE